MEHKKGRGPHAGSDIRLHGSQPPLHIFALARVHELRLLAARCASPRIGEHPAPTGTSWLRLFLRGLR